MMNKLRADNCTAVTALLDPPGPPLTGLLMPVRKPDDVVADPDPTLSGSDVGIDTCEERLQTPENNPSELAALLSAPVVSDVTPVPPALLETSLPLDTTPADVATPLRVLRNRMHTSDSLENNRFSSRKSTAAPASATPPLGSQLASIRKKVVTMDPACLSRKRPMTRSRLEGAASEERNASDTENHVNNSSNNAASSSSSSKRSRKSLPIATSSSGNHRILRSGTSPHAVGMRSLRSQDSFNLRLGQSGTPIHLRKKRSRSFTPMKRRK